MLRNNAARYTYGFLTKYQHRVIRIVRLIEASCAEFLEQEQPIFVRRARGKERVPAGIFGEVDVGLIIEPCALHLFIRNVEAERVYQDQFHPQRRTGTPHRPGVARDLGLDQDDGGHAGAGCAVRRR